MLSIGDKFICPSTPYFKEKKVADQEVEVITVTDFHYKVWTKNGTVNLSIDEVNRHAH